MVAFGVLTIGMGVVDNFVAYLVLMAVYGVAITMVQIASTTLFQEKSSSEMIGRVFGLFGAVYSGFLPIGMVVFGPLADIVSMRLLMVGSGVLLLIMAVFVILNREFFSQEAELEIKEELMI